LSVSVLRCVREQHPPIQWVNTKSQIHLFYSS